MTVEEVRARYAGADARGRAELVLEAKRIGAQAAPGTMNPFTDGPRPLVLAWRSGYEIGVGRRIAEMRSRIG